MREGVVSCGRDADHFDLRALVGATRKPDRGLARRRQDQHALRAEPVVVGEIVLGQPAGDEQAAQQRVTILCVRAGLVEKVPIRGRVCPVHGRVRGTVRPVVAQAIRRRGYRHVHVASHRVPAVVPPACRHPRVPRLDDFRPAHGRHATPACLAGGKEIPVPQRVARGCVGHRVRGQREALDPETYLPCREVRHLALAQTRLVVCVAVDLQRDVSRGHRGTCDIPCFNSRTAAIPAGRPGPG